jgi:hypothetical protein
MITISDVAAQKRALRIASYNRACEEILAELRTSGHSADLLQTVATRLDMHPGDVQWTLLTLANRGEIMRQGQRYLLPNS